MAPFDPEQTSRCFVLGAKFKIFELMSQQFRHDRGLQSIDLEGQRAARFPHW
jgi:hypothetical protein